MGVDAGDLDGSGRPSLFITNSRTIPILFRTTAAALRRLELSIRPGRPSIIASASHRVLDADLDGNLDIA